MPKDCTLILSIAVWVWFHYYCDVDPFVFSSLPYFVFFLFFRLFYLSRRYFRSFLYVTLILCEIYANVEVFITSNKAAFFCGSTKFLSLVIAVHLWYLFPFGLGIALQVPHASLSFPAKESVRHPTLFSRFLREVNVFVFCLCEQMETAAYYTLSGDRDIESVYCFSVKFLG